MKTIIAVTFFGILTCAFADTLVYGKGVCQDVDGFVNLSPERLFNGTWYLTHATPSTRVTPSTICRDFVPKMNANDKTFEVTYGYYENGGTGNRYEVSCSGTQNKTRPDISNFNCKSRNGRGENTNFDVDVTFLSIDYDKFAVLYRCVTIGKYIEDNVFLIFREKSPDENTVRQIKNLYSLNDLISRKDATCKN